MRMFFALALTLLNSWLTPNALGCEPKFISAELTFPIAATKPFEIDLRSQLIDPLNGNTLEWGTFGVPAPPSWVDSIPASGTSGEKITGTPGVNDSGTHSFNLSVQCGDKGSTTRIVLQVIIVPEWDNPGSELFLGDIQEDGTLDINLNEFVSSADNSNALVFTETGLQENAPWLQLEQNGRLHGTPPWAPNHPLVGAFNGIVFTATHPSGGASDKNANGNVTKLIRPPKWDNNPISLPDVNEGVDYDQSTNQFVTQFELNPLTFEKLDGPNWIQMDSATGKLFGKPGRPDVGPVQVRARAFFEQDGQTFEDETTFTFNVNKVNKAPEWLIDPIRLPDAFTGVPYPEQDISTAAKDDDGDTLTFEIKDGPEWASLSEDGKFTGTPEKADIGENKWTVIVKDPDGASDEATVIVQVIKSNEKPEWLKHPTVLADGKEDDPYSQDLKLHVTDPDNDPLTFEILNGPNWARINSLGFLVGTPGKNDTGLQKFRIRVSDGIPGHFDDCDILVMVEKTNHAPKWVLEPVFRVNEEDLLKEDLARFVMDEDDGDELLFEIRSVNPPSNWATIQPDGSDFGGIPKQEHVGENKYIVRATDKGGLFDEATVTVIVVDINRKPFWVDNPIKLPDATEGQPYNQSLANFASDPDGDALTFSKLDNTKVPWLNVRDSGAVWGTPQREDVGTKTFPARVMDPAGEFADVTVEITVIKVNSPPRWTRDPIPLDPATENQEYSFDITPFTVDDDPEDVLTYSKKEGEGPEWLKVSPEGILSGIPRGEDIGKYLTVIVVSDGKEAIPCNAEGEVLSGNKPPVVDSEIAYILFEFDTFSENLVSVGKITDPENDTLSCSAIDSFTWISLTDDCTISLAPVHEHIGEHTFRFSVSDGINVVNGEAQVLVKKKFDPPIWTKDPIEITVRTNESFERCVGQYAQDPQGLDLIFSCQDDPLFAFCRTDGCITGLATESDLGVHKFKMTASNGILGAQTNIHLKVVPGSTEKRIRIGEPVEGARVENLWVVDLSRYSKDLVTTFRDCIHHYYDTLNAAKIHHSGVIMSSDAERFDGKPIDINGKVVFKWTDDEVSEFKNRTRPYSSNPWWTDNCYNTPLWAMQRFYERLPLSGFFDEFIPMDAMMVTCQRDHYPRYTSSLTPEQFAANFKAIHSQKKKPFRTHRLTPKDYNLTTTVPQYAGPRNAYQKVVDATDGEHYHGEQWNWDMPAILRDYARKVIERAYIFAKRVIDLDPPPSDPSRIKVSLAGKPLTGNSGSASDQWTYQPSPPAVVMRWENIDLSDVSPDDWIVIEYPINEKQRLAKK